MAMIGTIAGLVVAAVLVRSATVRCCLTAVNQYEDSERIFEKPDFITMKPHTVQ